MNRTLYPLGPLWVLIGIFWLVSLLEPATLARGGTGWGMPRYEISLPLHLLMGFLANMIRGVALSQFLLLAVWLTLAKGSEWLRILGVTGVGLLSLLFWTSTSWSAWESRYYGLGGGGAVGGEWSLVVMTLAPFLLLAVIFFTNLVGRRALGYCIAGPANFRPVSRGARLTALWLSGILTTLVLLIAFVRLVFEPRFLVSLGDFWFDVRWALTLQEHLLPLAALVITPFTGLPWLALVIDAPRRRIWWILAPSISTSAVMASLVLGGIENADLSYVYLQIGHVLGILGTLSLLAACGWQWGERETKQAESFDEATTTEPIVAESSGAESSGAESSGNVLPPGTWRLAAREPSSGVAALRVARSLADEFLADLDSLCRNCTGRAHYGGDVFVHCPSGGVGSDLFRPAAPARAGGRPGPGGGRVAADAFGKDLSRRISRVLHAPSHGYSVAAFRRAPGRMRPVAGGGRLADCSFGAAGWKLHRAARQPCRPPRPAVRRARLAVVDSRGRRDHYAQPVAAATG